MCRPLWAAWVSAQGVMSEAGEGSHRELRESLERECAQHGGAIVPCNQYRYATSQMSRQMLLGTMYLGDAGHPEKSHPFEAVWTQKREAQWQPNTNRFYSHDDMPTRKHFDLAQERFEKDMGTPDLLRDWVLAGAKLFGAGEDYRLDLFSREPLLFAASMTLSDNNRKHFSGPAVHKRAITREGLIVNGPQCIISSMRDFTLWADMFSSPKNRVDLWKN